MYHLAGSPKTEVKVQDAALKEDSEDDDKNEDACKQDDKPYNDYKEEVDALEGGYGDQ